MTRGQPKLAAVLLAGVALAACLRTTRDAQQRDDLYAPSRAGSVDSGPRTTGSKKPPDDDAHLPPAIARWGELTRLLGQNLRSATTTCKDVAGVMRDFTQQYGKEYGRTLTELGRWETKTDRKTVDAFYRRSSAELDLRIDAGIRCKDHAEARQAFDAFFKVAGLDTR